MNTIIPTHSGTINYFVMPLHHACMNKGTATYVPYQDNTGVCLDTKAESALRAVKVIGWDWLPERLQSCKMLGVTVYGTSTSQREADVTLDLNNLGFHLVLINFTVEDYAELAAAYKNASTKNITPPTSVTSPYYKRVRYLWRNHVTKFTPFEADFVRSIGTQLGAGKTLTPKQIFTMDKILNKYQVPYDATAGLVDFS